MRNAYQTRKSGTLEKNTLLFEIEIGDENKNERKGVAQGEVGGWPDMEGGRGVNHCPLLAFDLLLCFFFKYQRL